MLPVPSALNWVLLLAVCLPLLSRLPHLFLLPAPNLTVTLPLVLPALILLRALVLPALLLLRVTLIPNAPFLTTLSLALNCFTTYFTVVLHWPAVLLRVLLILLVVLLLRRHLPVVPLPGFAILLLRFVLLGFRRPPRRLLRLLLLPLGCFIPLL